MTFGGNETEDVRCVISYLRNNLRISKIGLWGRSMGAVTALLYAYIDSSICCLVLDSPFCDLQ